MKENQIKLISALSRNLSVQACLKRQVGLLYFLLLIFFASCERGTDFSLETPENSEIIGLATPIQLKGEMTTINLDDYFDDPTRIDSVGCNSNQLKYTFYLDERKVEISNDGTPDYLSNLTFRVDGFNYDFLVKKSLRQKRRISYTVPTGQEVKQIQLVGDLNNWDPANSPMTNEGDIWFADLNLNPGRYPYQIVVDGKWELDPANPEKISNGMGGFNSLLIVEKPTLNTLPFLFTKEYKNNKINLGFINKPEKVFVYWDNYLIPNKITENGIEINIPESTKLKNRSFIRVYSYNEKGFSNDLKIPLENGIPIFNPSEIERMDKEAMIMYFPLVDRFNNGNPNNDDPLKDKRLTPIQNYMGGDLKGITKKINDGYFKDLGVNTLWVSPITQNPLIAYQEFPEPRRHYSGYHGYWPISSSKIDHRFGTDEEMHELVEAAHDNDMNILLDYVCNHVHEEHPIYKQHPEWATQLNLPNGEKNIRIWDEQRLTTWFDTFMPTLDLSNPEVIKLQADSTLFWLKKFNLDGYRHDATKHVPEAFWRHLTKEVKKVIKEENREIYQIGETYGSHELISSYINSGMVDSQFDFNLHFTARDVFAKDGEPFTNISNALRETFDYYGYHSTMGNISGNHDQTRFMGLASGAVAYDEDAKEAGYARKIEVRNKEAYRKLANMHAFLMSVPGVPVVYYGDEIGMVGASDPDNRRMMRFDNLKDEESKLKETTTKLINTRKNSLALIYGDTYMLKTEDNVLAYARIYFDEVAIIIFNQGIDNPVRIELPDFLMNKELNSKFGNSDFGISNNTLSVKIPKGSFDYLMN